MEDYYEIKRLKDQGEGLITCQWKKRQGAVVRKNTIKGSDNGFKAWMEYRYVKI